MGSIHNTVPQKEVLTKNVCYLLTIFGTGSLNNYHIRYGFVLIFGGCTGFSRTSAESAYLGSNFSSQETLSPGIVRPPLLANDLQCQMRFCVHFSGPNTDVL